MTEQMMFRHRIGQTMTATREALADGVPGNLRELLEAQCVAEAEEQGWKIDPLEPFTFAVSDAVFDFFATNRMRVIGELTVRLTEQQWLKLQVETIEQHIASIERHFADPNYFEASEEFETTDGSWRYQQSHEDYVLAEQRHLEGYKEQIRSLRGRLQLQEAE